MFKGDWVQEICRLTPEGTGQWVGSDDSQFRVGDNTLSISTPAENIDVSYPDLLVACGEVSPDRYFDLSLIELFLMSHEERPPSMIILDLRRTADGWQIIGSRIDEEDASQVWLYTLSISGDGKELKRDAPPRKVSRPEKVRCWCALGAGRAAVGYASGRIEILTLNEAPPRLLAVAFTLTPPEDMAVTSSPAGRRLVVIAGDVVWFDLAQFCLNPATGWGGKL